MDRTLNKKGSGLALVPFLIFVVIYLGAGLILQSQGVEMAFYQFPSVIYIGKSPTRGELNKEHSALIKEADAADFRWNAFCDRSFDGTVHIQPELETCVKNPLKISYRNKKRKLS